MNTHEIISHHLFQKGNGIILICDGKGCVTRSSDYAFRILGEGIIGRNISELFIDFQNAINLEALWSENKPQQTMISINTESEVPETFIFSFHKDDQGNIVVLGNYDSEELLHMKKELMDNNNELLNLSRELQRKNSELDRLNKLKNEFVGIAAHDLRGPIGNIWTITEILMTDQTEISAKYLELIGMIRNISDSMLILLNDLLDISAIESGKLKLNLTKNRIVETIDLSENLYLKLAEKRSISIKKSVFSDIPDLIYDDHKIRQVLSNLISNALKFSNDGSEIVISAAREERFVRVAVQDFGVGIPEKDQSRLFKPFAKSSAASPSGEKCTGLGLAIVRKIITAHKGAVSLESREGEGTVVSFSLPIGGSELKTNTWC